MLGFHSIRITAERFNLDTKGCDQFLLFGEFMFELGKVFDELAAICVAALQRQCHGLSKPQFQTQLAQTGDFPPEVSQQIAFDNGRHATPVSIDTICRRARLNQPMP